jgi:hypothetical protein
MNNGSTLACIFLMESIPKGSDVKKLVLQSSNPFYRSRIITRGKVIKFSRGTSSSQNSYGELPWKILLAKSRI